MRQRIFPAGFLLLAYDGDRPERIYQSSLFAPRYQHYYFGDYYAASYQSAGFFPWFSFQSSHLGYDPIYAHQRWQYRKDPRWEHRMKGRLPEASRPGGRPTTAYVGGPGIDEVRVRILPKTDVP